MTLKPQPPDRRAHPWVYDNEIAGGPPAGFEDGGLVRLLDPKGHALGVGYANRRSKIAARYLTRRYDEAVDDEFWRGRIQRALAYRQAHHAEAGQLPVAYPPGARRGRRPARPGRGCVRPLRRRPIPRPGPGTLARGHHRRRCRRASPPRHLRTLGQPRPPPGRSGRAGGGPVGRPAAGRAGIGRRGSRPAGRFEDRRQDRPVSGPARKPARRRPAGAGPRCPELLFLYRPVRPARRPRRGQAASPTWKSARPSTPCPRSNGSATA